MSGTARSWASPRGVALLRTALGTRPAAQVQRALFILKDLSRVPVCADVLARQKLGIPSIGRGETPASRRHHGGDLGGACTVADWCS
jgi:hypothetical protein